MAPVIHVVNEHLGLAYTMIVLAGSVALSVFFAFVYKTPEGVSEDLGNSPETESTTSLNVEQSSNKGCAKTLKSYGKIFTSPAMAFLLGKASILYCFRSGKLQLTQLTPKKIPLKKNMKTLR